MFRLRDGKLDGAKGLYKKPEDIGNHLNQTKQYLFIDFSKLWGNVNI